VRIAVVEHQPGQQCDRRDLARFIGQRPPRQTPCLFGSSGPRELGGGDESIHGASRDGHLSPGGLAIPHWPKEYGGTGLTLHHLIIIADEMARADAPRAPVFPISLIHLPGTLFPHDGAAEAPLSGRRGQWRCLVPRNGGAELGI
jgi:hypothetical protein